jgi:hypothetical protein
MADVSGPPHISHVEASGGDPSIGCGRGSGNVLGAVGLICTGKSNTGKVDTKGILVRLVISLSPRINRTSEG